MVNSSNPRPVIIGCRTLAFNQQELEVIQDLNPLGMIIFGEACTDGIQGVISVTNQFKKCVGRNDAPVLVDNEGGKVLRFKPNYDQSWRQVPAPQVFADLYKRDPETAKKAVRLNAQLIAHDMMECGVNVNCAPVVDLISGEALQDTGKEKQTINMDMASRCLGDTIDMVTELGWYYADGLMSLGVTPIIKHIPGLGRMRNDPHYAGCRIDTPYDELRESDFKIFSVMKSIPAAMTSHAVYTDIDPENSATLSKTVIQDVVRKEIGYEGLLITDALEMNAIKPDAFDETQRDQFGLPLPKEGALTELTQTALDVGNDIILHCHCSGDIQHTVEVLEACAPVSDDTYERLMSIRIQETNDLDFDAEAANKELHSMLN